jgi:FAD:protein FMN transferase
MQKQLSFRAMNTNVYVYVESEHQNENDMQHAMNFVQEIFQQVETIASRFLPTSELQQLNRSSEQHVTVSPILFDLLKQAYQAHMETDGVFNPGILPNLEILGYDRSMDVIKTDPPKVSEVVPIVEPLDTFPYELNETKHTIWLHQGAAIDLGGIAKGWTVDRAANILRHYGTGYVNAGGDIRFFGERSKPWNIGVENPFDQSQDIAVLSIPIGAVATSSTKKRKWKKGVQDFHHLIDPFTGTSTTSEIVSATVVAQTATQADVWAKTLLLVGSEKATEYIQKHQLEALFVGKNGEVRRISHAMVE